MRYVTAAGLAGELVDACGRVLSRAIARCARLELLLVDELGCLHSDDRGGQLLFQVITEREERAWIAVATNAPFSEWGQTLPGPRLAAAVTDRLTFNAIIIETGAGSYRLRAARTAEKANRS